MASNEGPTPHSAGWDEVTLSMLMIFYIKLSLGMAHYIFTGLLLRKLRQQALGHFKAFTQAGIDFMRTNHWRHAIINFYRAPAAF